MRGERVTDDVMREVTRYLRERYAFDEEDLRLLGARLADDPAVALWDVVEEVWRTSRLSETEALALADEEKHAARE